MFDLLFPLMYQAPEDNDMTEEMSISNASLRVKFEKSLETTERLSIIVAGMDANLATSKLELMIQIADITSAIRELSVVVNQAIVKDIFEVKDSLNKRKEDFESIRKAEDSLETSLINVRSQLKGMDSLKKKIKLEEIAAIFNAVLLIVLTISVVYHIFYK